MAKHVGQFPLVGTLGGINFYEHEFAGNIARMKPGPSREKVKKDKRFARTRKYNSEFGRASTYGSLVRRSFHDLEKNCKNGSMHFNLVQRFTEILHMDKESPEGKRDFRKDTLTAFRHFEMDEKSLSKKYFELPVVTAKKTGLLDVSACICLKNKPRQVSAWRVTSVAAGIDFRKKKVVVNVKHSEIYDFEKGRFEIAFSHDYNDQLPLFHGMCIAFYKYDAVIDEYRLLKEKHLNAGFTRCVQG